MERKRCELCTVRLAQLKTLMTVQDGQPRQWRWVCVPCWEEKEQWS